MGMGTEGWGLRNRKCEGEAGDRDEDNGARMDGEHGGDAGGREGDRGTWTGMGRMEEMWGMEMGMGTEG